MNMVKTMWLVAGLMAAACTGAAIDRAPDTSVQIAESWPPLDAPAHSSAFSEQGLQALSSRMESYVDDDHVLGISWLLVKDGEVAQSGTHGLRNAETASPVTDDTIYRIYSMTKPITGVALMQLYEDGKFDLDDPLSKYIPEFADLKVLAGENPDGTPVLEGLEREPTIRDAMRHTAGFAYGLFGDDYANRQFREQQILRSPDLDTLIDRIAGVPLLFQPGERWSYSVSVDIQAYLVETLSGQTFSDYLQANMFDPLNMDDTGFYVPDEEYSRMADLTVYNREEGKLAAMPTSPETRDPTTIPYLFMKDTVAFQSGGHGLVSTLDDYARFCQMMLNDGALSGARIISPETVALMTSNQLPDGVGTGFDGTQRSSEEGEPHKFGLDWGLVSDPEAMKSPAGEGTYYWGGAAGTWFWIDP
ncbi:MAG: serine hydrolase domain-containing protein, partial [Henriciella sp.]|uniref:serine hydrolase domain-containing protein n=1 Tax=Henriciella sp. TaxID=1968823 RepID=UPI003C7225A5